MLESSVERYLKIGLGDDMIFKISDLSSTHITKLSRKALICWIHSIGQVCEDVEFSHISKPIKLTLPTKNQMMVTFAWDTYSREQAIWPVRVG